MVKEIIHDEFFLQQKSAKAVKEDIAVAQDLLDTLAAHHEHCVGLAANMIGVAKCIIAVNTGAGNLALLNPEIVKHSAKTYKTTEGCLSLTGERETERYETIEVKYRDMAFAKQRQKFSGFTAQIIQHEIDHCQGILI
jgi:peptide deformylase